MFGGLGPQCLRGCAQRRAKYQKWGVAFAPFDSRDVGDRHGKPSISVRARFSETSMIWSMAVALVAVGGVPVISAIDSCSAFNPGVASKFLAIASVLAVNSVSKSVACSAATAGVRGMWWRGGT